MYLHCHNCGWSQDDFYDEGYNPAKYLLSWNDYLIGDKKHRLNELFSEDIGFINENGYITTREVIAREYESYANRIRNMKWLTYDDFKKDFENGTANCPNCGDSTNFDID